MRGSVPGIVDALLEDSPYRKRNTVVVNKSDAALLSRIANR